MSASSLAAPDSPSRRIVAVWLLACGLLGGCGQKGPLTLPPPASAASAPPAR